MTAPLVALAVLSLAGGYFDVPRWLEPLFPRGEAHHSPALVAISVAAGFAGIALAWLLYVVRPALADRIAAAFRLPVQAAATTSTSLDEIYDALMVQPDRERSRVLLWHGIDVGLIDGAVNGAGIGARGIGGVLRRLQSGYIRSYAVVGAGRRGADAGCGGLAGGAR